MDGRRLCVPNNVHFNKHPECAAEWSRRRAAGKYVKCGESVQAEGRAWCVGCVADPDARYMGHPGER